MSSEKGVRNGDGGVSQLWPPSHDAARGTAGGGHPAYLAPLAHLQSMPSCGAGELELHRSASLRYVQREGDERDSASPDIQEAVSSTFTIQ